MPGFLVVVPRYPGARYPVGMFAPCKLLQLGRKRRQPPGQNIGVSGVVPATVDSTRAQLQDEYAVALTCAAIILRHCHAVATLFDVVRDRRPNDRHPRHGHLPGYDRVPRPVGLLFRLPRTQVVRGRPPRPRLAEIMGGAPCRCASGLLRVWRREEAGSSWCQQLGTTNYWHVRKHRPWRRTQGWR